MQGACHHIYIYKFLPVTAHAKLASPLAYCRSVVRGRLFSHVQDGGCWFVDDALIDPLFIGLIEWFLWKTYTEILDDPIHSGSSTFLGLTNATTDMINETLINSDILRDDFEIRKHACLQPLNCGAEFQGLLYSNSFGQPRAVRAPTQ